MLVLRDAGSVGGVGHIYGYGRVWFNAVGGASGSMEPDLLLHARHSDYLGAYSVLLREQPQRLQDDDGTYPIVQGAGGDASIGVLEEALIQDPHVADAFSAQPTRTGR
jgi:hypothetical protein